MGNHEIETRHVYKMYGEIASGGMASIRLARQAGPNGLSRIVAIKKLHDRCAHDPEFTSMFRDEVRLAGRVIHPNVVPMLDVVAVDGELLLVMEYVHGESVARLARLAHVSMPPAIASTIMVGVLHGLHAAHRARSESGEPLRLIHRDVTPHNVMVGVDGLPRILDFGIAHAMGRMQTTRFGQVKGKLAYMAPEQLVGDALDARVDVYSAAVTLWEMLAGRKLFDGRKQDKVAQMILERPVERPGLFQRGIPPELDAIVLRALQRPPDQRFSSAREMAVALEQETETVSATVMADWVARVWGEELVAREQTILDIETSARTSRLCPAPWEQHLADHVPSSVEVGWGAITATAATGIDGPRRESRAPRWQARREDSAIGTLVLTDPRITHWASRASSPDRGQPDSEFGIQQEAAANPVQPPPWNASPGTVWKTLKHARPAAVAISLCAVMVALPGSGGGNHAASERQPAPTVTVLPPQAATVQPLVTMLQPAPQKPSTKSAASDAGQSQERVGYRRPSAVTAMAGTAQEGAPGVKTSVDSSHKRRGSLAARSSGRLSPGGKGPRNLRRRTGSVSTGGAINERTGSPPRGRR